jgi:hypothetical protein
MLFWSFVSLFHLRVPGAEIGGVLASKCRLLRQSLALLPARR